MLNIRTAWDRPARPPDGTTEHILLIGLTPQAGLVKLPANLCLLLDCSGSMLGTPSSKGQKLEDAKAACRLAAQCLNPDDVLSLVTFNSRPTVLFTAQRREALTDAALDDYLKKVKAEGATRTDLALAEAEKALAAHVGPGCVSAILLITDGHPTDAQGKPLTEYGSFYDTAGRLAAAGISIVTVGLGSAQSYNSAFLTELSDRGRGRFCYAPEATGLGTLLREQIHTTQASVVSGLEIVLTPRMSSVHLHGFCRITPQYLPFPLPVPTTDRAWRISCGTLEAEVDGAETIFLTRVETQGMFGISSGSYPILEIAAFWEPAAGLRAETPPTVAALNYTPILREQQVVTPEVQQLQLRWELNLYQHELNRSTDFNRTGQLLQQIAAGANALGLPDVANRANAQFDHLRRTGLLDADNQARTGQLLRETGRLSTKGGGMDQNDLGIGFGGGDTPSATQPTPTPTPGQQLVMDLAALEVIAGRTPGAKFPLNKVRILVGRNDPPHLMVDLDLTTQELGSTPMVSRRHAELSWEEGRLIIRDLGSSNNTFVNGERLSSLGRGQPSEPRELRAGDVVRLANLELRLVSQ